ncbi:hypothetical protein SAMN05443665_1003122 [Actinomadura meyerae]|uniref:Uncharacterized protein n=1 Tax=Actinomadura meyerae TaxID=240840 RepID=A0A239DZY2_9ACTN|nr:hypothetical protein SAMN05443665_1003122 [Actinomadura meyerae]
MLRVPLEVVRLLKGEPVLLGGMGASAIVVIIAFSLPDTGRPYAWVVAGLMFVLCLVRAVFLGVREVRQTGTDQMRHLFGDADGTNRLDLGAKVKADDIDLNSSRGNAARIGKKGVVGNLTMRAGTAQPPAPRPPAVDTPEPRDAEHPALRQPAADEEPESSTRSDRVGQDRPGDRA